MLKKVLIAPLAAGLISISACVSCSKENRHMLDPDRRYDVVLVIGQSNTHFGNGLDPVADSSVSDIVQLGRFGSHNYQVIPATEPLEHFTMQPGCIGFVMTFSKAYLHEYLAPGRRVLIIPGGCGGTGFGSQDWNPGDTMYDDAVARTRYVLENYNSRLVAILWHQGESDVGNEDYRQELDTMIVHLRKDVGDGDARVPFILGGMVPYWVDLSSSRIRQEDIISNTVERLTNTGFADPRKPFVISKNDNDYIAIHYDAAGQRELGRRYFTEFQKLMHTP